jgi:hypothetical protein
MSTLETVTDAAHEAPMRTYRMPAMIMYWLTAVLVFCMIASGGIAKQLGEGDLANTLRVLYRAFASVPEWGARLQRRPVLHWGIYAW